MRGKIREKIKERHLTSSIEVNKKFLQEKVGKRTSLLKTKGKELRPPKFRTKSRIRSSKHSPCDFLTSLPLFSPYSNR